MLRQQIFKKIASVSTLLVAIFSTGNAAAQLTLVSFGGAYQEAQSQTIWQPSAKVVGINFKEETWTDKDPTIWLFRPSEILPWSRHLT